MGAVGRLIVLAALAGAGPLAASPSALNQVETADSLMTSPWCRAVDGQLPPTVSVDRHLAQHVQLLLMRSPRFRAQCRAIAVRPWVWVRVALKHNDLLRGLFAESVIYRTPAGAITASVAIAWRGDWDEWLAHELEHVLEQADGSSLVAFKQLPGTWESAPDSYETTRAIEAGREVRSEFRHRLSAAEH